MSTSFEQQLRESTVFSLLDSTYHTSWIKHCLTIPTNRRAKPQDGKVFEAYEDCLARLNQYRIIAGCCFVTTNNRSTQKTGKSVDFACLFHGKQTKNARGLEPAVVRDPDSNVIISQRQRDRVTRTGHDCKVVYVCSFHQRRGLWIGRWRHQDHSDNHFPLSPMYFTTHLKQVEDYQQLVELGGQYRLASVPYTEARQQFREIFRSEILIKSKQYYNLHRAAAKDVKPNDQAASLIYILEERR